MRKEIWWLLVSLIAAAAMGLAITRGEVEGPKPVPTASKVAVAPVNVAVPMPTKMSVGVVGGPKRVWRRNPMTGPLCSYPAVRDFPRRPPDPPPTTF